MIRRIAKRKPYCLLAMVCFATGLSTGFLMWGLHEDDLWNRTVHGRRYRGYKIFEEIIGKWRPDDTKPNDDLVIKMIGGDVVGKYFDNDKWINYDTESNGKDIVGVQKVDAKDGVPEDEITEMRRLITPKIKDLKQSGLLVTMDKQRMCRVRERGEGSCIDPNCTSSLPPITSTKNLESVLKPVKIVGKERLNEAIKAFNIRPEVKEYVIITAASSNHFNESQAAIQSLHRHFLPHITNYSFYMYDLGLTKPQRQLIRDVSGAELRPFPFKKLPDHVRYLKCYTWKALLILAHIQTAKFVLWLDTSIRLTQDIRPYFQKASKTGLLINRNKFHMPQHTHLKMFSYYGDQACQFSPYGEVETGFLVFHNEPFIRKVIVEPWGACALDHNCMCPPESIKIYRCPMYRQYGKCHRYEQTNLGYIMIKVFRENRPSLFIKDFYHIVGHDHEGSYLLELKKAKILKQRRNKHLKR